MRVKIHIELITDWDESTTIEACEFSRPMTGFGAETLGLSLEDGKVLLQAVQQHVGQPRHGRWLSHSAPVSPAGGGSD